MFGLFAREGVMGYQPSMVGYDPINNINVFLGTTTARKPAKPKFIRISFVEIMRLRGSPRKR